MAERGPGLWLTKDSISCIFTLSGDNETLCNSLSGADFNPLRSAASCVSATSPLASEPSFRADTSFSTGLGAWTLHRRHHQWQCREPHVRIAPRFSSRSLQDALNGLIWCMSQVGDISAMAMSESEIGMPHGGKNDEGKGGVSGPIGEMSDDKETVGDALSKVGFEPAKVGRKVVSQGHRRESLKRWASRKPDQ